jgi:hypothetical protein
VLDRLVYLNAGTFGPLARGTVEAMTEQASRELETGRVGEAYYASVRERRERIRAALAARSR